MIIRKEQLPNGSILGVWKIEESREELLNNIPYNKGERAEINEQLNLFKSESRILEWLSIRSLLYHLTNSTAPILYKESGKPHLKETTTNIGISHTKGFAAIILNNKHNVAIDIEYISQRAVDVKNKFISPLEYINPKNEQLHCLIHWSAKETLYKISDIETLDFTKDLIIDIFEPEDRGILQTSINGDTFTEKLQVNYEANKQFVLTWITKL